MLVFSFVETLATPEFNDDFDVTNLDHVQALTWIGEPALPEAQHIVYLVSYKANGRYKSLEGLSFNSEACMVSCEIGRDAKQDQAMRHLASLFLRKLNRTVFRNLLYNEDANILRYPRFGAPRATHGDESQIQ